MKGTMKRSLEGDMDRLKGEIINAIYPVGAIYISVSSTSPETLFGGSWEQIKDRFLLAAGSTYEAGSTGGEANHTLTSDEMPKHVHTVNISDLETLNRVVWKNGSANSVKDGWGLDYVGDTSSGLPEGANGLMAAYTGGNQPHNNMPPYLAVYVWKRVA